MASFDERVERIAGMMMQEAIEDAGKTLIAGQLASHADYRYHCGVIAGLRRAQELLAQALIDIQKG